MLTTPVDQLRCSLVAELRVLARGSSLFVQPSPFLRPARHPHLPYTWRGGPGLSSPCSSPLASAAHHSAPRVAGGLQHLDMPRKHHSYHLCRKDYCGKCPGPLSHKESTRNKKTPSGRSGRVCRQWAHLVQVSLKNYLLPELSTNNKRSFSSGLVVGDIIENRDPSGSASQDTRHGRRP